MSNKKKFNIEEYLKKIAEAYEGTIVNTIQAFKKDLKNEEILEDEIIEKMTSKWESKTIRSLQIGLDRMEDFYIVI